MKLFLYRLTYYFFYLFAGLFLILTLLYNTKIFTDYTGVNEVVKISETKTRKKIKKIYIGDSVADQLFGHHQLDSSGTVSMSLNAAMTVYGHYLLLTEFCYNNINSIDSNTEIILAITLKGLATDLTKPTTFNYFIKPFYNSKYLLKNREEYVDNELKKYKFLFISQSPIVKFRPYLTENIESFNERKLISDINKIGINKLIEFTKSKNIKFSIQILPLSDFWKNEIPTFKNELKLAGLNDVGVALNSFETTPNSFFVFDHVHFKSKDVGREFLNGKNSIVKTIVLHNAK